MEFKIILKKINNTLTEEEFVVFEDWYNESNEHKLYFERVKENYLKENSIVDLDSGWKSVSSNLSPVKSRKNYYLYAASIAAIAAIGIFFMLEKDLNNVDVKNTTIVNEEPIKIGTNKAILTLEDGTDVALEKGKDYKSNQVSSNGDQLVYQSNSKNKKNEVVYNLLTVPSGGQFFIQLADGTKVWLNSESKLRYPVVFEEESRVVELIYGEAFFEVSPSELHNGSHFIVTQNHQKIEVLGTQFNIKAYADDSVIATTLVEGKVMLTNGSSSNNLAPGQQATFDLQTKKTRINHVDIDNEISWKTGFFSFKNKSLVDITKVLSRWYDVDFVFENKDIKDITFNGVFRKSQRISEILESIENTNELTYSINQKTITMK